MKNIFFISILLISSFGFGQAPVIEWEKSLGGSGYEYAYSIQQTTDNGYIVVGDANSDDGEVIGNHGLSDNWVLKLDESGNIIWQKSLGGSGQEFANSIEQTSDGGYVIAGLSDSNEGDVTGNNGSMDYWVVKLDASGNITWQKSLGGSQDDNAQSIQQTADGGYIVAGWSSSNDGDITTNYGGYDYWVVKLDASGNIIWQKSVGGTGDEKASSVEQTTDGGYIVTGWTYSNDGDVSVNKGGSDYWVVKLDDAGNITWQKSLGGSGDDHGWSIQQTTDGGYVVAGLAYSGDGDVTDNNGDADYWIIKLDLVGDLEWEKSFGGSLLDYASSIKQTLDGGYIVTGSIESSDGDISINYGSSDYWIVKLNTSGDLIWQKSMGGTEHDSSKSIQQTNDGGYIVAGTSSSNNVNVTGNHGGSQDYWIVKLSPELSSTDEHSSFSLELYPNPATNSFTITSDQVINASFKIVDAQGKEVMSGKMSGTEQSIDISSLSKGAYSIVFEDSELPVLSVIKE